MHAKPEKHCIHVYFLLHFWPVPSAQQFEWAVPVSSDYWQHRQSYPGQVVVGRMKGNAGLRLLLKPKVGQSEALHTKKYVCSSIFLPFSFHLFHIHPVEALDLLLLVLPLFAEGQQLILQVANLLLQLSGLRVEALFLPLKHTQTKYWKHFSEISMKDERSI